MSSTSTSTKAGEDLDAKALEEAAFEQRKQVVIEKVENYTQIVFNEMHVASRKETELLLNGTKYIDKKDIDGWEKYVDGEMQNQVASARKLYQEFMDPLLEALSEKAISERVIKKLYAEFRSEDIDYKDKEKYVKRVLPERLKEWKNAKKGRDELIKNSDIKTLKSANIEHFDKLFDEKEFADMKWADRKKLIETVSAILAGKMNCTEHLMPDAQAKLEGYVEEGILHESKVSTWMKRIFTTNVTPKSVQQFIDKVVVPYAQRWRETKEDFDNLHTLMEGNVPRGFQPWSADKFLLKDYKERTAYCALLKIRLENVKEEDKEFAGLKLYIRHCLDTQDWVGAENGIKRAHTMRSGDNELRSMQEFVDCQTLLITEDDEQVNEESDQELMDEARWIMAKQPPQSRWIAEHAAEDSLEAALSFEWIRYNRIWVHEHGYSNQTEDTFHAENEGNKENTRQYMKEGHTHYLERNIVDGDTAAQSAIRDDCTKPQMLYVGDMGRDATLQKVITNKNNFGFNYWTTYVPDDEPYEAQNDFVKNYQYRLKQVLRELDKRGLRYSVAGNVNKKADEPTKEPAKYVAPVAA